MFSRRALIPYHFPTIGELVGPLQTWLSLTIVMVRRIPKLSGGRRARSYETLILKRMAISLPLLVCLGLSMPLFAEAASTSASEARGGEDVKMLQGGARTLKGFLTTPPAFLEMVAEVSKPPPRLEAEKGTLSSFVLVRRQENAFFYREAPSLLDLLSTNSFPTYRLAGFYDDQYWDFSIDNRTLTMSTNNDPSMRATLDNVLSGASIFLHLGVFDCLPGSLRWTDDRIMPFTNHAGVRVDGTMEVSSEGIPQGLALSTEYKGHRVPWQITYEYVASGSLPRFLPGRITGWSLLSNGNRRFNFEVRVLTVRIGDQPQPLEYFSPKAFFKPTMGEVISAPGGVYYRDKVTKQLRPLLSQPRIFGNSQTVKMVRAIFLIVVMLTVFAALYFGWRRAPKKPAD
jgi:hypothetical protein